VKKDGQNIIINMEDKEFKKRNKKVVNYFNTHDNNADIVIAAHFGLTKKIVAHILRNYLSTKKNHYKANG
jgi:hypothetical protein